MRQRRLIPGLIPLDQDEEAEFERLMAFEDDEDEDAPPPTTRAGQDEQTLSSAHIVQSYTAILILGLLSDDFTRLDRTGLLRFIARCQCPDGSCVFCVPKLRRKRTLIFARRHLKVLAIPWCA